VAATGAPGGGGLCALQKFVAVQKMRPRPPEIEPSANSGSPYAGAMTPRDWIALPGAFSKYLTWIKARIASSPI
jgi:hypothetical protein